jgi:tripeptide aminopeptidase
MNLQRLIDLALEIQSIPAPTFQESKRAKFIQAKFQDAGLDDVSHDAIGNVYGRVPGGSAAPVIVCAHLDTVFDIGVPLNIRREGDKLYGPGIGDNTISLAALIELAKDLPNDKLGGDVWLVGTVGEEGLGNLNGMRKVVAHFGGAVSAYIILEGMAFGQIYHRGLPIYRYRISVRTPGGHAWTNAGSPSAIHTLLSLGTEIARLPLPRSPRTSLNVGQIEGGTSINTIAGQASMEIDLRSEDESCIVALDRQIEALAREFSRGEVEISCERIGDRPGGGIPQDHPLVLAAVESLQAVGEKRHFLKIGSTDANIPLSLGFPAVCVGLTVGGRAHTVDEYIQIEPISRGYRAVQHLIQAAHDLP